MLSSVLDRSQGQEHSVVSFESTRESLLGRKAEVLHFLQELCSAQQVSPLLDNLALDTLSLITCRLQNDKLKSKIRCALILHINDRMSAPLSFQHQVLYLWNLLQINAEQPKFIPEAF